jgi:hypothetical protein
MTDFVGARSEIKQNIELAEMCSSEYVGEFGEKWRGSIDLDRFALHVALGTQSETFRATALQELAEWQACADTEVAHASANSVLCELLTALGFDDVVEQYNKIDKWYA